MALRLIEVFLPAEHGARLQVNLTKDAVVAHWMEQLSEQQILVRILLQVEDTEAFLDRIENSLTGTISGQCSFQWKPRFRGLNRRRNRASG